MRLEHGGDHLDDRAGVRRRALRLPVVFDAVDQIGDRGDVASLVSQIGARFGFADSGGRNRLPFFAAAAGRPTAVFQDVRLRSITALGFKDTFTAEDLQSKSRRVPGRAAMRSEV